MDMARWGAVCLGHDRACGHGKGMLHQELCQHRLWDIALAKTKMRQERTKATNSLTSNLCLAFLIAHT